MTANGASSSGALVVACDEEMRILLRGLLQLHRVRVEAEAEGATEALRLLREHRSALVVVDAHLSEGTAAELIAGARATVPGLRIILIAPASRPAPTFPEGAGPDALLLRPFRIRQFADAVVPPSTGPGAGPGPG